MLVNCTHWEAQCQSSFQVDLETASLALNLVEVARLAEQAGALQQPFSLLFHGPAEPLLSQGIYPLRHHVLGELSLFLVPLGPQENVQVYEAVFS